MRVEEATPDQAARLAEELGRLLDSVQIERLDFERLARIVPDRFAGHWQQTLQFLRILTENRSEEHTSELQSLMRISYAVFYLKKKKNEPNTTSDEYNHTKKETHRTNNTKTIAIQN